MEDDEIEIPWLKIALACVAIGMAVFILNAMGWISFKTWGPKWEEARRETFENSTSYVQGKQTYLVRLWREWSDADGGQRTAICAVARHEASTLDAKYIPETIKKWECVK